MYGRQWRSRHGRKGDIVEPDNRNVLRHAESCRLKLADRTDRHQIVRGHYGSWPLVAREVHQFCGGAPSTAYLEVAAKDQLWLIGKESLHNSAIRFRSPAGR